MGPGIPVPSAIFSLRERPLPGAGVVVAGGEGVVVV